MNAVIETVQASAQEAWKCSRAPCSNNTESDHAKRAYQFEKCSDGEMIAIFEKKSYRLPLVEAPYHKFHVGRRIKFQGAREKGIDTIQVKLFSDKDQGSNCIAQLEIGLIEFEFDSTYRQDQAGLKSEVFAIDHCKPRDVIEIDYTIRNNSESNVELLNPFNVSLCPANTVRAFVLDRRGNVQNAQPDNTSGVSKVSYLQPFRFNLPPECFCGTSIRRVMPAKKGEYKLYLSCMNNLIIKGGEVQQSNFTESFRSNVTTVVVE